MASVDSNFNFLCGRPHGAGPPPPVHMRPNEPDPLPPPCGRHKWMAPKTSVSEKNSFMTLFFTQFVLSYASNNTTSRNIGRGRMHGPSPHLKFFGDHPP